MWTVLEIRPGKRPRYHGPFKQKGTANIWKIRLMTKHQDDDHEFYVVPKGAR